MESRQQRMRMRTATLTLLAVLAAAPAVAQREEAATFFRGKTVRLIVGVGVGSGYDINARLLARHMARIFRANRPSSYRISRAPAASP